MVATTSVVIVQGTAKVCILVFSPIIPYPALEDFPPNLGSPRGTIQFIRGMGISPVPYSLDSIAQTQVKFDFDWKYLLLLLLHSKMKGFDANLFTLNL